MRHASSPIIPVWSGLADNLEGVNGVVCDLWGVLHDGVEAHQNAVQCLINIRKKDIPVALLSNSPKPINDVWKYLNDLGIPSTVADALITSGSIARHLIRKSYTDQKMYHIGPSARDASTLKGLPVHQVNNIGEADFILCTGLDEPTGEAHQLTLNVAVEKQIPMICANPDRVVHVRDELQFCAGVVADVYQSLGGAVIWAGKPDKLALHSAATVLDLDMDEPSILVIGDSIQTDMAGAESAGYKGILIASGIHRDDILPKLKGESVSRELLAKILHKRSLSIPALESIMPNLIW